MPGLVTVGFGLAAMRAWVTSLRAYESHMYPSIRVFRTFRNRWLRVCPDAHTVARSIPSMRILGCICGKRYIMDDFWTFNDQSLEDDNSDKGDNMPPPGYPVNPCNCEHPSHFPDMPQYDPKQHEYLKVPAGDKTAVWVGKVCNDCANGHYRRFLVNN